MGASGTPKQATQARTTLPRRDGATANACEAQLLKVLFWAEDGSDLARHEHARGRWSDVQPAAEVAHSKEHMFSPVARTSPICLPATSESSATVISARIRFP